MCAFTGVQYGKRLFVAEMLQENKQTKKTTTITKQQLVNEIKWKFVSSLSIMLNLKQRKPSFKTVTLLPLQHKLNTPNLYNLFSLIEGVKNE